MVCSHLGPLDALIAVSDHVETNKICPPSIPGRGKGLFS